MICPFCSNKTRIYNSRSTQSASQTWRRHRCTICQKLFTTREKIDWNGYIQISSEGALAPYSRDRLLLSIVRATDELGLPSETATDLTDSIELELQKNKMFDLSTQDSKHITAQAIKVVARYDTNLALQYVNLVYRNKPPKQLLKELLGA